MADETAYAGANESAQFTEVMEVQVRSNTFVQGLQEIESAWDSFVKKINEEGGNLGAALEIGNTGAVATQIASLVDSVQQIGTAFSSVQKGMMETVTEMLEQIRSSSTGTVEDVQATAQQSAQAVAQSVREMEQQIAQAKEAAASAGVIPTVTTPVQAVGPTAVNPAASIAPAITAPVTFNEAALADVQKRLEEDIAKYRVLQSAGSEAYSALSTSERAWYQQTAGLFSQIAEKWDAVQKAMYNALQQRIAASTDAEIQAANKQIALVQTQEERILKEYVGALEKRQTAENEAIQKRLAAEEKANLRLIELRRSVGAQTQLPGYAPGQPDPGLAGEIAQIEEFIRVRNEREDIARKSEGVRNQITAGRLDPDTGEKLKPIVDTGKEATSAWTEFFGAFDNMPRLLGYAAGFTLAFTAIHIAIDAVTTAFMAIPRAIEEGLRFVQELERKAVELQTVLASNVKFSDDFHKNFEMAGEAAKQVQAELLEIAAKSHLNPDKLQGAFMLFEQSGGAGLTHNIQEQIQLASQLELALKTMVGDEQERRRLLQDIPALLSGSVTPANKMLEALHLTKEEWMGILQHATEHQDLLQQLAPKLAPYVEEAKHLGDTYEGISADLVLMKKQLEAAMALPLAEEWKAALKAIRDFYVQHQTEIMAIGRLIGQIVAVLFQFGQEAVRFLSLPGVKETVIAVFVAILNGTLSVIEGARLLFGLINDIIEALGNIANPLKAWDTFWERQKQRAKEVKAAMDAIRGVQPVNTEDSGAPTAPSAPGTPQGEAGNLTINREGRLPLNLAAPQQLQELEHKYAADLENLRAIEQQAREDAESNYNKGKISDAQLHAIKVQSLKAEAVGVRGLRDEYKAYAATIRDIPTPDLEKFDQRLKKDTDTQQRQTTHGIDQADVELGRRNLATIEQDTKASLQRVTESYQSQRAAIDNAVKAKQKSHADAAKAIIAVNDEEIASVIKTIAAAKAAAEKSGAPPPQIRALKAQLDQVQERTVHSAEQQDNTAEEKAQQEKEAVHKAHVATRQALIKEEQKAELALEQERFHEGLQSALQFFDAKSAIEEKAFQDTITRLRDEAEHQKNSPKDYAEAVGKIEVLEQQHTDALRLQSVQRQQLVRNEINAQLEYAKALQAGRVQSAQVTASFAQLTGNQHEITKANTEVLNARTLETQAAIRQKEVQLSMAQAAGESAEKIRQLKLELDKLNNDALSNIREKTAGILNSARDNPGLGRAEASSYLQTEIEAASRRFNEALKESNNAQQNPGQFSDAELKDLKTAADNAAKSLADLEQDAELLQPSFGHAAQALEASVLGPGFQDMWDNASGPIEKMGAAATGAAHALTDIQGIINQYEQGRKQGGVLGGVGSLLSSGPISDALSLIPGVGQFIAPLGSILSFIGGMFTAAARHVAEQIQKAIDNINLQYREGNLSLNSTLEQLQKERTDAIAQLSGKKGGKKELDKLLKELDPEIAQLKNQMKQIADDFTNQLSVLRLQSDVLGNLEKTWQDVRKAVTDYLGAVGNSTAAVQKAQEYLSLTLAKLRKDTQDQLNEGNKQAVQDAITLNQLLTQRITLEQEFQQKQFDLVNADAIERNQPSAIRNGAELDKARTEFKQQLDDLNSQIDLETQKVAKESQIFKIATDLASLRQQSNALELLSLDEQIQKWKDMRTLVDGIVLGSNGFYGLSPALQNSLGSAGAGLSSIINTGDITVNLAAPVNASATDIATAVKTGITDSLNETLLRNSRYGYAL